MNKKTKKSNLSLSAKAIVTSKGFYIALLTLIMVIGTVTVVRKFTSGISQTSSSFDDKAWEEAIAQAALDLEPKSNEEDASQSLPYPNDLDIPEESFPEITGGEAVATAAELSDEEIIKALDMEVPCSGKISRKHSPEKLVYFKTTDDWRTHNGIDIAAAQGTVVQAAADGVVEEVYEDKKLGIVVLVGHEGNIKTLYANLQDLNFISVGRKLAKGDAVGAIGTSALVEKNDDPHLHFEVIKNETSVNPAEYIPL